MEDTKITKEKLIKFKDIVIFILLLCWTIMPVIQSFRMVYRVINLRLVYFALMKIIGIVGIGLGIYSLYDKIRKAENKKEVIKEIWPIFIFVLYMIWTLISCIFSPNKSLAFEGSYYRKEGYLMYINYAGFFLCAVLFESKKLRKVLLNAFVAVSVFLIAAAGITSSGVSFSKIFVNNSADTSVFAQFNHYGYYLTMTLICCFGLLVEEKNKIFKIIYGIAYTVIGYMLIFNNTFGCYLAASIMLILCGIYSLIKKNNRIVTLIAVLIFVILSATITKEDENVAFENISSFVSDIRVIVLKIMNIDVEDEEIEKDFEKAGTYRMALWKNGINFIAEKPILGYGPENLKEKYRLEGITQDRPHNLLIQLATTSGIPGMILYVTAVEIIVIEGIKKLIKNNEIGKIFLIVVVTYLISAMFGNSMYYTSPYFFIFLGFLMNCNINKKERAN